MSRLHVKVLFWWWSPRQAVSLGHWAHSLSETPRMTGSAVEARGITSWLKVEGIAKGVSTLVAQQNLSSRCYHTASVADAEQQAVVKH